MGFVTFWTPCIFAVDIKLRFTSLAKAKYFGPDKVWGRLDCFRISIQGLTSGVLNLCRSVVPDYLHISLRYGSTQPIVEPCVWLAKGQSSIRFTQRTVWTAVILDTSSRDYWLHNFVQFLLVRIRTTRVFITACIVDCNSHGWVGFRPSGKLCFLNYWFSKG
jgi:hypothetical protein